MALRVLVIAACLAARVAAAEWYVAPSGNASAPGTREAPWDIESTLDGRQDVAPGDTLWLLGGKYEHTNRQAGNLGYNVRLKGAEDKPIHVRAIPGAHVTIDPGLAIQNPSSYLWIWDLELLVRENLSQSRRFEESGSHPKSYDRPHGGLNVYAGTGCKYINLIIHDTAQGVSFWSGATDSELHGCIIYANGWDAPDRGHGHAIYTQNEKGVKTISDCIMTGGCGYTMHAYGSSRAFVDHYVAEGNICYDAGTFLIGGGRPSRDIQVADNYLCNVSMQIGYSAPFNEDCVVRDNVIVNGGLTINKFKQVVNERNLILRKSDPRPGDRPFRVEIRPNKYDPDRFHVVLFNWNRGPSVDLELGSVLNSGDAYRIMDPCKFSGEPITAGSFDGKPIPVCMEGEFAAFVLLRNRNE
jgi:hypothetical protein